MIDPNNLVNPHVAEGALEVPVSVKLALGQQAATARLRPDGKMETCRTDETDRV